MTALQRNSFTRLPGQTAESGDHGELDAAAFRNLADLVRNRAGVVLRADRSQFIFAKLEPVARSFGFRDSARLIAELAHPGEELARAVTEAVTSQDTWFFRDEATFSHIRTWLLPALVRARSEKKRLRVWSAGCATGQEAFSLAILLEECGLVEDGWAAEVIATDLSGNAIARCRGAVYAQFEIERGLSGERRRNHFVQEGETWRASERLRRVITFRRFNLLDHFGWLGELDLILCRNVLMYLALEERQAILRKFLRVLALDGQVILGRSELCDTAAYRPVAGQRGVFARA